MASCSKFRPCGAFWRWAFCAADNAPGGVSAAHPDGNVVSEKAPHSTETGSIFSPPEVIVAEAGRR